jgi:hypothetical protein
MSGEGGILDLRARLAAVEPLAQAAVDAGDVQAMIDAGGFTNEAGAAAIASATIAATPFAGLDLGTFN